MNAPSARDGRFFPAALLDQVFPFHFSCGRDLVILSVGPSLRKMASDVVAGASIPALFEWSETHPSITPQSFEAHRRTLSVLTHRCLRFQLRGELVHLDDRDEWMFLGSPWFRTAEAVENAGLRLDDFAIADPVVDLLQVLESNRLAMRDLHDAAARLERHQEEFRRLALVAARTQSAVMLADRRGHLEWVNEAFVQMTGWELKDVAGRRPQDFLHGPDTDQEVLRQALRTLENGGNVKIEILKYHRDGHTFWSDLEVNALRDATGALSGFMSIESDITPRRKYETLLGQLTEELNAILALVPGGIVAFNRRDEAIYCNPAFETLTGISSPTVLGRTSTEFESMFRALCHEDSPPRPWQDLKPDEPDIVRTPRANAAYLARTAREITGPDGVRRWHVLYLRDVTREVEQEQAKSQFVSIAAHELRTPMASVHGFAELLMSREFDAATTRTIAGTIHRQSSVLVTMVNELLDLARIESGRGRDFDIRPHRLGVIVRETVGGLLINGDARTVDIDPSIDAAPAVAVDASQLRLALTNVLSNAYKFSRGAGRISVALVTAERKQRPHAGLRIADEGIGMTPEQVSRIFERFYRADPAGSIPGSGLGMSLVKDIIEIMGGGVEVSSRPGQGTCVTLWLPQLDALPATG